MIVIAFCSALTANAGAMLLAVASTWRRELSAPFIQHAADVVDGTES